MEMECENCGDKVDSEEITQCQHCVSHFCGNCMDGFDLCNACEFDSVECSECGDRVPKEELGSKGRCGMCNETMV